MIYIVIVYLQVKEGNNNQPLTQIRAAEEGTWGAALIFPAVLPGGVLISHYDRLAIHV